MKLQDIYSDSVPQLLEDFAAAPPVQRLKEVGMNCGCEYTKLPPFCRMNAYYSRYDHSIGCARIVWEQMRRAQRDGAYETASASVAALLHDIATPVFAHTVDFLNGDYEKQESTEDGTKRIIHESAELQELLHRYGLREEAVWDYHCFPIADNEPPRLSADRLEYTLSNGVHYGILSFGEAEELYEDLAVGINEEGKAEILFRNPDPAIAFTETALACGAVYISDEDRYAMQRLADILREALQAGVLTQADLYGREPQIIARLQGARQTRKAWEEYCSCRRVVRAKARPAEGDWLKVKAKKRWINPLIAGMGRVTEVSEETKQKIQAFLALDLDVWLRGQS